MNNLQKILNITKVKREQCKKCKISKECDITTGIEWEDVWFLGKCFDNEKGKVLSCNERMTLIQEERDELLRETSKDS